MRMDFLTCKGCRFGLDNVTDLPFGYVSAVYISFQWKKRLSTLLHVEHLHGVQHGDHFLLLIGQLQMAVVPEPEVRERALIWQMKGLIQLFHSRKLGVCQGSDLGSGFI